jgi:acyl-CoA reductase-like NAD-dependent aldehyde dehydrogenase
LICSGVGADFCSSSGSDAGVARSVVIDFIFFTGSTKVGKIVAKAAAEHLTPVMLELGGQNPAIVDGTGNIADAARKIVCGRDGEWCASPGFAYVHEAVADQFVAEAKRALVEMFGTDPKNSDRENVVHGHSSGGVDPVRNPFPKQEDLCPNR